MSAPVITTDYVSQPEWGAAFVRLAELRGTTPGQLQMDAAILLTIRAVWEHQNPGAEWPGLFEPGSMPDLAAFLETGIRDSYTRPDAP